MKIEVDIRKRYFLFLIGLALILGVIGVVYAYGTSNPNTFGHSAGELEGVCKTDGTGCPNLSAPAPAPTGIGQPDYDSGWIGYTLSPTVDQTITHSLNLPIDSVKYEVLYKFADGSVSNYADYNLVVQSSVQILTRYEVREYYNQNTFVLKAGDTATMSGGAKTQDALPNPTQVRLRIWKI